jgi:FAD synthetase
MPTSSLAGVSSDEFGNTSTISQSDPPSLPVICAQVHDRLETFLAAEPKTERIRAVQEQSRLSLRIIEEALEKYR